MSATVMLWSGHLATEPALTELSGRSEGITASTLLQDYVAWGGGTLVVWILLFLVHHLWFVWGTRRAAKITAHLTLGIYADRRFRLDLKQANQQLWGWEVPGVPAALSCTVDPSGMAFRSMRGDLMVRLPTHSLKSLESDGKAVRLVVASSAHPRSEWVLSFQPRVIRLVYTLPQASVELLDTVRELRRILGLSAPGALERPRHR